MRPGGVERVEAYVVDRLRSAFYAVSPRVGQLKNSRNHIYSLVFCCGNPNAEGVAMKIANHILAHK